MSDLSQFIGEDSRKPIQRLRRAQLHRIADAMGLRYPPGAPKSAMIQLFEANNVDVTTCPAVRWRSVDGVDSTGRPRREIYPVETPPASARNGVNAAMVLSDRIAVSDEEKKTFESERIAALERDNAHLRDENRVLRETMESRLAALENKTTPKEPEEPKADSPQSEYWAAYRKARDLGLPIRRGMRLKQIRALLKGAESVEEGNG